MGVGTLGGISLARISGLAARSCADGCDVWCVSSKPEDLACIIHHDMFKFGVWNRTTPIHLSVFCRLYSTTI